MFTLHHATLARGRKPFWLGLLFTNKNEIRFPEFLLILHGVAIREIKIHVYGIRQTANVS